MVLTCSFVLLSMFYINIDLYVASNLIVASTNTVRGKEGPLPAHSSGKQYSVPHSSIRVYPIV